MKKILSLLTTVALGSTAVMPNIFLTNVFTKRIDLFTNDIALHVQPIGQEQQNYCVPAIIQMIFRYFGVDLGPYSQDQIFQDLSGGTGGVYINEEVAEYLNNNMLNVAPYYFNNIPENFGANFQEQFLFRNYVYNSLHSNQPVLIGYTNHSMPTTGHSVLIVGIRPNTNPQLTQYIFINPGIPNIGFFTGNQLSQIFFDGGEIIGGEDCHDFQKTDIPIVIDDREVGEDQLNDYEDHQVVSIRTDITSVTGANTTGEFSNMIKEVHLPNFNGEIYNFTWRKRVQDFSFDLYDVPDNNDNWVSPKIMIDSSSEDAGSAHIEGRILAQVKFERTKSLNHLLMYLIIYVGGISWSTPNWAHVWFHTGNILQFFKF